MVHNITASRTDVLAVEWPLLRHSVKTDAKTAKNRVGRLPAIAFPGEHTTLAGGYDLAGTPTFWTALSTTT